MRHTRNSGEAARGLSVGLPPERISVSMRNALLLRRPRGAGPVAQWLELAAHNRLVGGSSPPGPTILSKIKALEPGCPLVGHFGEAFDRVCSLLSGPLAARCFLLSLAAA